ncbi:MAG: PilZ domain-containing protein [Candidatus Omnitrophica bacterium]|nr:PilZ domain-containing protein [Candidatus Omnitrophota bacterium]
MEQKIEEKRRFPRIRLKAPLRYQVRGRPEFDNSLTEDISLGGVSFTNDKFIPPATNLMLEISIFSRLLNPIGKVAWINPVGHSNRYRLGVEFLELDKENTNFLSQFIDFKKEGF